MSELKDFLKKLGACAEAVEWASDYETLGEAWAVCERPDWMMWLVGIMADEKGWPTRKEIVSLACDFAEDVLPIYEKKYPDDKRVRECIATVRKWIAGEATIEDVRKARAAADAATTAAYAYAYAYAAAYAAAAAAAYAAAAAATYDAAAAYAAATYDAAAAAYAAAAAAVREKKLKEYADLIRKKLHIPVEVKI